MAVCCGADRFQIDDVAGRIADGLAVHSLGVLIDKLLDSLGRVVFGEAHFYALAWQHVREQGVGAAIELRCRDDIITRLSEREDCVVNGRHARADCEARDAAFERSHALLEHVIGWIHDAAVNVAWHC